ncbi:MAG: Mrp/NBP35 family ATP-binding protein [Myxococcota bacterium]|jgi:ATP-binding protein involved in chromosome partitioning|nr:Mrp/NBP35 family ATP-binding protein [Myxococcota bacterium]
MSEHDTDLGQRLREVLQGVILPSGQTVAESGVLAEVTVEAGEAVLVLRLGAELTAAQRAGIEEAVRSTAQRVEGIASCLVDVVTAPGDATGDTTKEPCGGHDGPCDHDHGHGQPHAHGHTAGHARPAPPAGLPGVAKIVAVASGKGGVGKSTVAINLALALAARGLRVGLLDADLHGPSFPTLLGLGAIQPRAREGRVEPIQIHGLAVMSIGFLLDPDQPVIWRGPMINGALKQLLQEVLWEDLDVLVVDLPPGTGDAQLTLAQTVKLDQAVIVTTPSDLALADARRGLVMFRQLEVPVLGIIENMSHFLCPHCHGRSDVFGAGGGRRTAEHLGVPFLEEIPLDLRVGEGNDQGRPVVLSAPDSEAARAFGELGRKCAESLGFSEKTGAATDAASGGTERPGFFANLFGKKG